jgi:hypothetical protein
MYLAGHGNWVVQKSDTPWARVPPGSTLYLYTDNAHTLSTAAMTMIAIERGEAAAPIPAAGDILGDSRGEFSASTPVANYTLYPDTPDKMQVVRMIIGDGNVITVDAATPMCTGTSDNGRPCVEDATGRHGCNGLFALPAVQNQDIVWLACTAVGLTAVPGQSVGVNDMQVAGNSPSTWDDWENEAWANFQNMSPDDFWSYVQGLNDEKKAAVITWDAVRDRLVAEGRI